MEPINWNELLEDPSAIEASPLQRVIGIGVGRTVKGITIELLSIELREFGAFGMLRIELPSREPPDVMLYGPEIVVSDDIGTRYAAMTSGSSGQSPGRGAMTWMRHQFSIVPPIPSHAKGLVISVGRIGNQFPYRLPTPEGSVDMLSEPNWIDGLWKFEVELGP